MQDDSPLRRQRRQGGGLERKKDSAESFLTLASHELYSLQAPLFMVFSRQNSEVGCHFLLQGNFPTQELNPSLLHCRQMLCRLSYMGRDRGITHLAFFFGQAV